MASSVDAMDTTTSSQQQQQQKHHSLTFELENVLVDEETGYVSGVVDMPLTEEQRDQRGLGYTLDEWLALTRARPVTGHPLKDKHGQRAGKLVEMHANQERKLRVAAFFDPKTQSGRDALAKVNSGEYGAFSIGFDAVPDSKNWQAGRQRYKNTNFEVSVTDKPRKKFALIEVRCDMSTPGENTTSSAPAPTPTTTTAAANTTATSSSAAAANGAGVSLIPDNMPMPTAGSSATSMDVDALTQLRTMTPQQTIEFAAQQLIERRSASERMAELERRLAESNVAAQHWNTYQQQQEKLFLDTQMARLERIRPALEANGYPVGDDLNKQVLQEIAQSKASSKLLECLEKMAGQYMEHNERLQKKDKEAARIREESERQSGLLAAIQRHGYTPSQLAAAASSASTDASAPKRAATTQPASSPQQQQQQKTTDPRTASLLGLDKFQSSLFEQAAATFAAHAAASAPVQTQQQPNNTAAYTQAMAAAATQQLQENEQAIDIPQDPVNRLKLYFDAMLQSTPLVQQVRCSDDAIKPIMELPVPASELCAQRDMLNDGAKAFFFSDQKYWQDQAEIEPYCFWRYGDDEKLANLRNPLEAYGKGAWVPQHMIPQRRFGSMR